MLRLHLSEGESVGREQASPLRQSRLVVLGPGGQGEWGVTVYGDRISFWYDENIVELVIMVEQLCKYTKNH